MIGTLMPATDQDTHIPRLFRVILPVNDIEKAQKFYSSLLNMEGNRVSPGRHYFQCGGAILACFDPRRDGDSFDLPPNPDHIYFSVRYLNIVFRRALVLGAIILDEIKTRPWGETSFYMKDPFGNKICFVEEGTVFTGN
jgi:catechol 2,3-dioxygenase-like lactoylglutathione lyase family enzyme